MTAYPTPASETEALRWVCFAREFTSADVERQIAENGRALECMPPGCDPEVDALRCALERESAYLTALLRDRGLSPAGV